MTSYDVSLILSKVGEVRDLFTLGQRALPFLEEILGFLEEISPLLDQINASMRESTARLPHASSQLRSVSEATELATTEILDLVDVVLLRLGEEKERADQTAGRLGALARMDEELLALVRGGVRNPTLLETIEALQEERRACYAALVEDARQESTMLAEVRGKISRIMISLQVQDITTQQIAAVNHLIESVRRRMTLLIERLGATHLENTTDAPAPDDAPGTFDPAARYAPSDDRQARADEVVSSFQATPDAGLPTQNDIDLLFGGDGYPATSTTQDEIDQIFGVQRHQNEPATQTEIDRLFGGATCGSPRPPEATD